ncbi:MAG: porin [Chitinispirillia bacterium]|nr:porin [Chitinispirillia bacterium]
MKKTAVFICMLAAVNIAFADMDDDDFDSPDVKVKTKKTDKSAAKKAPAKNDNTFRFSGIAETGVDVITRIRDHSEDAKEIRSVARGDIGISARPVKNVRAEIGIEYDKSDTFLVIDKFYGQYSFSKNSLVRAGIMKKVFGLEERDGLDDRYFRSRSIIRSGVKDEGFLGHDLTLQYRHNVGKEWRFVGGLSMSEFEKKNRDGSGAKETDTLRYLQNYSAHYRAGNIDVIGAAVIQHYNVVSRDWTTTAFVSSLSCRYSMPFWTSDAELTYGSSLREKIKDGGTNEDIFILGVRKQEQFYINTGLKTLRQVIPVAEAAFYWNNFDDKNSLETQIRGGVTLGFAKNNAFQFRNTYGAIISKQDDDKNAREESKVKRYRFDSVVVVIF